MAKSVVKQAHQECVIKVWGPAATTELIELATLVNANQQVDGDTQTVSIVGLSWSGAAGGVVTITRNSVVVATLQANATGQLFFDGQTMPPEITEATSDISVAITGAASEVWIKMRKIGGYASKSGEYATYGAYEDEARVGASTTINGSPDYTEG